MLAGARRATSCLVSALRKRAVLGARAVLGVLAVVVGVIMAVGWPWALMPLGGLLLLVGALVTGGLRVLLLAVVCGVIIVVHKPALLFGVAVLLAVIAGRRSRR